MKGKMYCKICGREANKERTCNYFLEHGETEETLRSMYSDDEAKKIWRENEKIAEKLADAYYDSVIENYKTTQIRKTTRKVFGYNTFIDGIRAGLDIVLPMLDEEKLKEIKEKIKVMIKRREMLNKKIRK